MSIRASFFMRRAKMKILVKDSIIRTDDTKILRMVISAPHIAQKAKAGQFVSLMVCREGERIPLTIVEADKRLGAVTIIFQEVGLTTKLLGKKAVGESLYALTGPLGHPTEIRNYGNVILVGGGVGIAEIYPVGQALKEAGNHITTIIGARTKTLLILEKELKGISAELFIATDDGSYGQKGFTTDVLKELLQKSSYGLVYAVGPIPMMSRVAAVTKQFNIRTIVSLNAIMVDATGMCGCCRVSIGGQIKFSCVDGPEFDGHTVDWDELTKRNRIYIDKEKHICKLNNL